MVNDKTERKKSQDGIYLLSIPEYKISSGVFVNTAGDEQKRTSTPYESYFYFNLFIFLYF